jgi:NAD(P) transhydrogenase
MVGGNCTHRGTIPSKALRQSIQMLADTGTFKEQDYQSLLSKAESVVLKQVDVRQSFYDRNELNVFHGRGAFLDAHTVEVALSSGGTETLTSAGFLIATGSRPYHPPDIDFTHPRIVNSDSVLKTDQNPKSITIYGAGVIGCEYASIFRGLRRNPGCACLPFA